MKLTHGMKIENEHEGVRRVMSLQRYDDSGTASYHITIETTPPGEGPIKAIVSLSEYGYSMFCEFMAHAPHELSEYKFEANNRT